MEGTKEYTEKIFEEIKHIDENGREYWEARELQVILDYKRWQKFQNVIKNAKTACGQSKFIIDDHFTQTGKMINLAKGAVRKIQDYKLSRYACYLIVQNADSSKEVVALGQTYFAIQTRKQELSEKEYSELTEDEKKFYQRNLTKKGNYSLNITARNCGYKRLYNGETANDIAKRKGLRYREDILDNMGSEELVANLFRISQTEAKLKKDKVKTEIIASAAHYEVGKKVRRVIKDIGGTMPENLPTPDKSLKELKKENKKIVEYDLTEKS